ncbi:MAG: DUF4926 domain-containing protein [Burkholderiales bacterium]
MKSFNLLDVVATSEDIPSKNLVRDQIGTVVELLSASMFEVEFCDDNGRSYLSTALDASQLILLRR